MTIHELNVLFQRDAEIITTEQLLRLHDWAAINVAHWMLERNKKNRHRVSSLEVALYRYEQFCAELDRRGDAARKAG